MNGVGCHGVPCRPFRVWPSFLQLLSQRCASYLPVHLCLLLHGGNHAASERLVRGRAPAARVRRRRRTDGRGVWAGIPGDPAVLGRALAEGVDGLAVHGGLLLQRAGAAALLAPVPVHGDVLGDGVGVGIRVGADLHGDAARLGPGAGAHGEGERVRVALRRQDGARAVDVVAAPASCGEPARRHRRRGLLVHQLRVPAVHVVPVRAGPGDHRAVQWLEVGALVLAVAVAASVVVAGVVQAQRHRGSRAQEILQLRRWRRHHHT